ncbi:MAG TPA: EF-hand domain-containing protein [Bacteroidetes bacterium]|nr:EF-hand domain-containing protein [Bacteroidota bacterium]
MVQVSALRTKYHIVLLIIFTVWPFGGRNASAQELFDSLMMQEFPVENPLSRPAIGIGTGTFSFLGDVNSNTRFLIGGKPGLSIYLSSFLDEKQRYRLNFVFTSGKLTANQMYSGNNLNFMTDITSFGASLQYDFGHVISRDIPFKPFVGGGVETFQFNPKGDLSDAEGNPYVWLDNDVLFHPGELQQRDFIYETNLRNPDWSTLDNYSKYSFAVPLEVGFRVSLAPRVSIRMACSWHITLTDNIDNYNSIRSEPEGNRMTDIFRYTSLSIHLDPFSEPRVIRVINLYEDVEADPLYLEDEDGDMVLDFYDECLDTPEGVAVDSLGCPLDSDNDGVPNYLDEEPGTPEGLPVNRKGIALSEEELLTPWMLEEAAPRNMLDYYFPGERQYTGTYRYTLPGIPERFREFETDRDGYISFEELLRAIDSYFDYETTLDTQGVYDLINFFFAQ